MELRRYHEAFLEHLPALVADLLKGADSVQPFVQSPPSMDALVGYAGKRSIPEQRRKILAEVLAEQNRKSTFEEVQQAVADLAKPGVLTVTTGHQLNALGGPAYFVYKIAHAVALARSLERSASGIRVVPVFWMASEDHDFAEIATVANFRESFSLQQTHEGAVGPMPASGLSGLAKAFIDSTGGIADSTAAMLSELGKQATLADATRALVDQLFGRYGVVVLDAADTRLKGLFTEIMHHELLNGIAYEAIEATNTELIRAGYSLQLTARPINLFYLSEGSREGIIREGNRFKAGSELDADEEEILGLLSIHPERFSPSAALRPVYQEFLLPNLAYIGGPGEMSYWLQLKGAFDRFGVPYPILVPRNSVTVIGKKETGWMGELGLDAHDLLNPVHELTRRLVLGEHESDPQLRALRERFDELFGELAAYMGSVDASLQGKAAAAAARWAKELSGLENAVFKARKQKEEIRVKRLERIHAMAFPAGPQERVVSFFALSALTDEDLIERCVNDFRPEHGEWLVYLNQ